MPFGAEGFFFGFLFPPSVSVNVGPYFPRRGQKVLPHKSNVRPPRPQFQMFLHNNQVEAVKVTRIKAARNTTWMSRPPPACTDHIFHVTEPVYKDRQGPQFLGLT